MTPTPRPLTLPLALALALLTLTSTASPLAQSSARVTFVSPPHSYSHSVNSPVSRLGGSRSSQPQPRPPLRSAAGAMTLALLTSLAAQPAQQQQHPGYFLERPAPSRRQRLPRTFGLAGGGLRDPEAAWPAGVFLPPGRDLRRALGLDLAVDLGVDLELDLPPVPAAASPSLQQPDPFLRTGEDAVQAVRRLLSLGAPFFGRFPHAAALLRHQRERLANGLAGHRLGSIRPRSPFYRWPAADAAGTGF